MTKTQRLAKEPQPNLRRITVRLTEPQYERVVARAREWQDQGIGSRSLNDWCLIQLIGEANDSNGSKREIQRKPSA